MLLLLHGLCCFNFASDIPLPPATLISIVLFYTYLWSNFGSSKGINLQVVGELKLVRKSVLTMFAHPGLETELHFCFLVTDVAAK
jgi:hypothetical protein